MKIRFEGPITVIQQDENGENEVIITSPDLLKQLDGKTHDDELADYIFDGGDAENLRDLGITGGKIGLSYKDYQIYAFFDYFVEKMPNKDQLKTLWGDVCGQLSDGAGPIFSGYCEDETGLYPLLDPETFTIQYSENT